MAVPTRLDAALHRLSAALSLLEAAAQQRAEADASRADPQEEFALLQADRSRLAVELDDALARNQALLSAQTEVMARLDRAGATVSGVLAQIEAEAPLPEGHGPETGQD